MFARPVLAAMTALLALPTFAAGVPLPVTPFAGISLGCVIKQTSQTTSYLGLSNPTAGTIPANTQVVIKTDHSAPFTVKLTSPMAPGGSWSQNSVPVTAKHCTARTATLVMQLPQPPH